MSKKIGLTLFLLLAILLVACGGTNNETPANDAGDNTNANTEATNNTATNDSNAAADDTDTSTDTSGVTELNILWAQWDPADYLQEIGNMYEAETGIKVNVIQEPWGSFGNLFFAEMAAQGTSYDMVVGDSQWLGQGATQGHYLDMTDFLVSEGIAETVTPATLASYGEYPPGSGTYYGYPTEGDADG